MSARRDNGYGVMASFRKKKNKGISINDEENDPDIIVSDAVNYDYEGGGRNNISNFNREQNSCCERYRCLTRPNGNYAFIPIATSSLAWIFSVYCPTNCTFVIRELLLPQIAVDESFGVDSVIAKDDGFSRGIGFWGWEYDEQCYAYYSSQFDRQEGAESPSTNFDKNYWISVVSALVAQASGGLGAGLVLITLCFRVTTFQLRLLSVTFLLACVSQGMTLTIFSSDLCTDVKYFAGAEFTFGDNVSNDDIRVKCRFAKESILSLCGCLAWFFSFLVCVAGSPTISTRPRKQSESEDEEEFFLE